MAADIFGYNNSIFVNSGRKHSAVSRGKSMYSFQSRIRYSELDETGHLTIEALLDYFQDCSTFQSEDLGLGIEYLKTQHMLWVMSSWQIVAERYPVLGENVTISTLPYDFKGFIGYRNFMMTDAEGKRLACANTIWSLLDTETGKPARPMEEMLEKYKLEPRIDMEYAPRRIAVPGEITPAEEIVIRPHHLDTNHHVNNGQFVKIAMECLPPCGPVRQLRAEYKKQALLGDVLFPSIASGNQGQHIVELKDRDKRVCCIVEIQEDAGSAQLA